MRKDRLCALCGSYLTQTTEKPMPLDLSDALVIGITATALFDLEEADNQFQRMYQADPDNAIEEYRAYMAMLGMDALEGEAE